MLTTGSCLLGRICRQFMSERLDFTLQCLYKKLALHSLITLYKLSIKEEIMNGRCYNDKILPV